MGKNIWKKILCPGLVLAVLPLAFDTGHSASASPPDTPPPRAMSFPGVPTIAPGETRIFTVADGGSTACAEPLDNPINLPPPSSSAAICLLPRYGIILNGNDPSTNFLSVFSVLTGAGVPPSIPAHAASAVYNEFTVEGSRETLVDAQIAVTFDYVGNIVGVSLFRYEVSLSLVVQDVTDGQPVGALSLFSEGRNGSQGVTDIAGAAEIVPVDDASNGFIVKLRRGHTYRVWFQLEVDHFGFGLGRAEAQWSTMAVSIDEDCEEVSQQRKIQGCNGLDDDCDGTIDECDEDNFGPDVHIDQSVAKCCYDTPEEAAKAVAAAVDATDDCGAVTVDPPTVNGNECDVPVKVVARDDCGNRTMASTTVRIDGKGPQITINPAVHAPGVCYASIDDAEQAVLGATTITDNCDPADDLTITLHSSVDECALRVRITAVDKCGNESTAAVTVRVDTHLPTVDIEELLLGFRGEVLAFQTPPCYDTVAEAEAAVLAVTQFADNCTAGETLVKSVFSSGDPCSLAVASRAVDECLNQKTDSVTVRVDPIAPVVTCAVAIDRLWPANHVMVNVGFTFTATDNCTGEPKIEIFVTSDETTASANGAGQTSPAPDAFILRNLDGNFEGILLRAERSTAGDGRVYRITVRATDQCGNVGSCSAVVGVPPNGNGTAVDGGQFFDATAIN